MKVKIRTRLPALLALVLALFMAGRADAQQPSTTQVIDLNPGWNLISIQVGGAITPAAFKSGALDIPATLIEIWGYAPTGDPLLPGHWNTYQPTQPGFPNDLATMQPGRGYWVNVGVFCKATLTGATWDGDLVLQHGWNLIGFPGLVRAASEAQDLSSIFGSNFARIPQIYTFDSSSAQRFVGYDTTAIPMLKELVTVNPGRGYWVYALEPLTLQSQPFVALIGDADASPLQSQELFSAQDPRWHGANPAKYANTLVRYAAGGDADYDLNNNGIIDTPTTQDTIRFEVGVDRKAISIGNTGISTFGWAVINSVPWLFTAPSNPNDPSNTNRARTTSGTISSETDTVTLYVDRTGLRPGKVTGQTFTIYTGSTIHTVSVILDVPTASGDWKGYASAAKVNGKAIGLGKIDLFVNLFMNSEQASETGFRAVLNRDLALLFPRDVFMNGVFYSGNDFSFTTNFQMNPGDRNAPPYDTFTNTPANDERGDKDSNANGKLDVMNPFPFAVQREITLLGRMVNPDRMEGTYVEAIGNMLPAGQKIFIDGTFQLDRQTTSPTKRSIFNQTNNNNPLAPVGGSSGNPWRDRTITVGDSVNIQNITVTLNLDFTSLGATVTLIGPNGQTVLLHPSGTALAGTTVFTVSDFNNLNGAGNWTLRIGWDPSTGERGTWANWSLNIAGLATYTASGIVVDNVSAPIAGAHVVLAGSNVIKQTDTAADGTFAFTNLTESSYSVSISKSGYNSSTTSFFLLNQDVALGNLPLAPLILPDALLSAEPPIGAEPLFVDFSFLIPFSQLGTLVGATTTTWDFGDNTPVITDTASATDDITATHASHIYTTPGDYTATATIVGATSGSISRQSAVIHVQRTRPSLTGAAHQIVGVSFVGGFAAPLTDVGNPVQVSGNIVFQESKRDSAPFDIDRFPFLAAPSPFRPSEEDTDFDGSSTYTIYQQPRVLGVEVPDRWRIITTLGGAVFGEAPSRVGDFLLQTGRVQP